MNVREPLFGPDADRVRDQLAARLGPIEPASSSHLTALAQTVADRRTHDHPTGEDIYCHNLAAWAGERIGPVLRRLADAEASRDQVLDLLAAIGDHAALPSNISPDADRTHRIASAVGMIRDEGRTVPAATAWLRAQEDAANYAATQSSAQPDAPASTSSTPATVEACRADYAAGADGRAAMARAAEASRIRRS